MATELTRFGKAWSSQRRKWSNEGKTLRDSHPLKTNQTWFCDHTEIRTSEVVVLGFSEMRSRFENDLRRRGKSRKLDPISRSRTVFFLDFCFGPTRSTISGKRVRHFFFISLRQFWLWRLTKYDRVISCKSGLIGISRHFFELFFRTYQFEQDRDERVMVAYA